MTRKHFGTSSDTAQCNQQSSAIRDRYDAAHAGNNGSGSQHPREDAFPQQAARQHKPDHPGCGCNATHTHTIAPTAAHWPHQQTHAHHHTISHHAGDAITLCWQAVCWQQQQQHQSLSTLQTGTTRHTYVHTTIPVTSSAMLRTSNSLQRNHHTSQHLCHPSHVLGQTVMAQSPWQQIYIPFIPQHKSEWALTP